MNLIYLCDDVLDIIIKNINIKCHICQIKFRFTKNFYKKQDKLYFCSEECYNFI